MKKDLTQLARDMEKLLQEYMGTTERVSVGICFTMPPQYDECFFVTNLSRTDGIRLFEATAAKMRIKAN